VNVGWGWKARPPADVERSIYSEPLRDQVTDATVEFLTKMVGLQGDIRLDVTAGEF